MKKIVNLTPYPITIVIGEEKLEIMPSGTIARWQEKIEQVGSINGIPVIKKTFGKIENLPQPSADTIYIVSALVAQAAKRYDVLCPGDPVRDENGRIIGCKALCSV